MVFFCFGDGALPHSCFAPLFTGKKCKGIQIWAQGLFSVLVLYATKDFVDEWERWCTLEDSNLWPLPSEVNLPGL